MFARFDENPAMTLQDIKKQNVTDGRMDGRTKSSNDSSRYHKKQNVTDGHTDARMDNVKTVYPPQTKFAAGIIIFNMGT